MRKILNKLVVLAILCVPATFIIATDTYAETGGEIIITEDSVYYESDPSIEVREDGFNWDKDTKTLTLTNYHSKTIAVNIEDVEVNLVLNGENTFEAEGSQFLGLTVGAKNMVVSGDGTLGTEGSTGNTLLFPTGGGVTMNSGKIISRCASEYGFVVLNDGEFIIDGNDYGTRQDSTCPILFLSVNGGSIKSNRGIMGYAFNQTGGELEITAPGPTGDEHHDFEDDPSALAYQYAIFDDGTASLKGGGAAGMVIVPMETKENIQAIIDDNDFYKITLPEDGFVNFNGGDVTIETEGIYGSIAAMYLDDSLVSGALVISDDLTVEPDSANYTVASIDTGYGVSLYGLMNNGEGETTMDFDKDTGVFTVTNVAKNLHIFIKDDEQEENIDVPNSGAHSDVDAQASVTLLAVITGFVVAAITYRTLRKTE